MKKFTDRSRIITYQRCGRQRFLEYHEAGVGIRSLKTPLPLAVGGAVHAGLAVMLRFCVGKPLEQLRGERDEFWRVLEEEAVKAALMDFKLEVENLEVDANERGALLPTDNIGEMLAQSLGLAVDDPQVQALVAQTQNRVTDFDKYLQAEQTALVEGMVRAYARRRLRPLWEQFEVLEVEREGMWKLAEEMLDPVLKDIGGLLPDTEIWFMSRPDAILLERESGQLYILSFKTTSSWDIRKGKDAEHDMQGLSEGVEVEKRLGELWAKVNAPGSTFFQIVEDQVVAGEQPMTQCIGQYLRGLSAPPRIFAIRYEFLLKGDRRKDKDLSQRLGVEAKSQASHLVRGLWNHKTSQWNWSWTFKKDDGTNGALSYQNWQGKPVWEAMTIKAWIDLLDSATPAMSGEDSTVGLEPRLLGYSCSAQASGYTEEHPLDSVFMTPIVVYRHDDDLRDWLDQTEAQEIRIQEGLVQIEAATDPSEKRHLLNVYFPLARHSCEYPSTCQFVPVCYGGEDIRSRPMESGKFKLREPNHPMELQK